MVRGYLDGRDGKYEPPNFPNDRDAYDHGQRSAENDRSKGHRDIHSYVAERRAQAQAIIEADDE